MKISVIVPNLSGEIYLQDCEASLAAQPADIDLEILIENDDKNSPKGVAAMRNLGLEAASGDFVFFLDSDDYVSDNAFSKLLNEARKNPDRLIALNFAKTRYKRESVLSEESSKREISGKNQSDRNAPTAVISRSSNNVLEISNENPEQKTLPKRCEPDSVLGILIPSKYIKDSNAIRFDESLKYYSDIPFMAKLISRAGEFVTVDEYSGNSDDRHENELLRDKNDNSARCVYYKRSRNDAIRYPSLNQIKDKNRYSEFARACRLAAECYTEVSAGSDMAGSVDSKTVGFADSKTVGLADRKPDDAVGNAASRNIASDSLQEYICRFICDKLTKGKHPEGLEWTAEQLADVSNTMQCVSFETIGKAYSGILSRILKRLKKGKLKAAQRLAKLYVMNRKKKGLLGSTSQWKWNIYKRIFRKLPVKKNLFLFESFLGKNYGDSCKAIYEYMIANEPKENIEYVWIIDNKDAHIPGKHKEAKPLSFKYFYYVARCGAWINNMRQPAWYEKREGVRFLETWHGTPLKKLVFDMDDVHSASPEYKMTFYKQSRIWDWLVSDNRFSTDAFESAFLFPRDKILELGYPRNDLLYGDDRDERAARIREKLGIPKDKKVVLYAPTWRDDDYYGPGQYKFELPLDLDLMESLKDEYFFILRTHYFIADHLQLDDNKKQFVMDCSRYNDIGELYLASDVLITDYSSVFFDFANLRRPILFYVYDFEKYRDTLRGFYFDMESGVPGPLLFTNQDVLEALKDLEGVERKYADKYREFADKFCSLDDGHAAERVVKAVFEEFKQ